MSLLPYDPFRPLSRAFNRFFSDVSFIGTEIIGTENGMQMDVQETDNEIIITCKIPGLTRKEDVNIQIEKNILTIDVLINKMVDIQEKNMFRRERYRGRFRRSVSLPCPVSRKIKTSVQHGVLEVKMPKLK